MRRSRRLTVLVLGWSEIARRRVIPALQRAGVTGIDIASITRPAVLPDGVAGVTFRAYDDALARSDAKVVYVSTRNHEHAAWAAAALESGRHVIVDKPAAISLGDVERLAELAARRGGLIAEATVYPWHPQIQELQRVASESGPATRLVATFSFPRLPPGNVRHRAEWGGGMLWDLGPYAVTPGRLFFGDAPIAIAAQAERADAQAVDSAFSVLMRYPGDRVMVGHFGMTTAYVNRLAVLGPRIELTIDRAFTTAPDQGASIVGQRDGARVSLEVPAADAFEQFLRSAMAAAVAGRHQPFSDAMLADALAIDRLRRAALTGR